VNVGFVGLGKLGLPVAYTIAARGLVVYGYDPYVSGPPSDTSHEEGFAAIIDGAADRMQFVALGDVIANCDTIFIATQTPHEPRFEGITPLPVDRADFDYTYLTQAVRDIVAAADGKRLTLSVISTVLPGTMAQYVAPLLPDTITLVYTPSFIAMGRTIRDFVDPEFILIGGDDARAVEGVYRAIHGHTPVLTGTASIIKTGRELLEDHLYVKTTVENAELIKVAYNTFIGLKIAFANTLMEVCHKTGCDIDQVTGALKQAHRRLISPAYLDGGMGDGGGCHPRDNIALSWLARELDLSYDLFDAAMTARERQAEWLCDLMGQYAWAHDRLGIAGVEYKPGTRITTGSHALLVKNMLEGRGHIVAVWPDGGNEPRVWLIGCKHPEFATQRFPAGSVVIDPFRYIPDQPGVEVVRLGQWEPAHTDTSASTNRTLAA
jgi:UDPglucose 6-dehydrogenase